MKIWAFCIIYPHDYLFLQHCWNLWKKFGTGGCWKSTLLHSRCGWTEGQNLLDVHYSLLQFDVDTSKYIWAESSTWSKSNAHGLTVFEPHIISFDVHKILINFFFSPFENLVFSPNSVYLFFWTHLFDFSFVILKNNSSKSFNKLLFFQSVWQMHEFWLCLDLF